MKHTGTPRLETDRLILRRITLDDAEDMFCNWASDEQVTRHLTWKPHPDVEASRAIIRSWQEELERENCYRWCLEWKENGQVIGCIDVVRLDESLETAVIGYCMSKQYWNRGIMTEALVAVEDYLFGQVGVNRIEAHHLTENPASGKVMLKSGMQFEGIKRQGAKDHSGNYCNLAIYAMLKSDWAQTERSL